MTEITDTCGHAAENCVTHGPFRSMIRSTRKLSFIVIQDSKYKSRRDVYKRQALRREVEGAGLLKLYEEIDLPLVPVLARMEHAGVKIDRAALAEMSSRLEHEIDAKAKEIYQRSGSEFNISSPKQLGDVLFNKLNLPKPVKYGKGKTISTAVDVLEGLAEEHDVPRFVLEYRQLTKLKSTYVDALPALLNPASGRLHTTFGQTGTATGRRCV